MTTTSNCQYDGIIRNHNSYIAFFLLLLCFIFTKKISHDLFHGLIFSKRLWWRFKWIAKNARLRHSLLQLKQTVRVIWIIKLYLVFQKYDNWHILMHFLLYSYTYVTLICTKFFHLSSPYFVDVQHSLLTKFSWKWKHLGSIFSNVSDQIVKNYK